MPRKPQTEAYADLTFPVNGLDQSAGYQSQRPLTTRLGQNVRAFEPSTQRGRGGQRPGLSEYVPAAVPAGAVKIQNLATVVTVSQQALPWSFSYPFLNFVDPSSPGLPFDWGPGRFSRVPPLLLPPGGWLFQPAKNLPHPVKIVWPRPADISQGTALGGVQLNAQAQDAVTGATVPGSFSYSPGAGVVLPLGQNEPLSATFTASDPANYQSGIKAANSINVVQGGRSPIAFVQQANQAINSELGSHSLAFPSGVTSGNLLLAVMTYKDGVPPGTPTDSQGNTWTNIASVLLPANDLTGAQWVQAWRAFAGVNGPCTVNFGAAVNALLGLAVLEYANVSSLGPVDTTATNTGVNSVSTAVTTGNMTASAGSEMALGFFFIDDDFNGPFTPDASVTARVNNRFLKCAEKPGPAAGGAVAVSGTDVLDPVTGEQSYGAVGVLLVPR